MSNTQSRIICTSHGYIAELAGFKAHSGPFLCVTREGKGGKYVSGPIALEWAEALETSIDSKEQAALCRAIYDAVGGRISVKHGEGQTRLDISRNAARRRAVPLHLTRLKPPRPTYQTTTIRFSNSK